MRAANRHAELAGPRPPAEASRRPSPLLARRCAGLALAALAVAPLSCSHDAPPAAETPRAAEAPPASAAPPASGAPRPAGPAATPSPFAGLPLPDSTLEVNGLLNSGFEWIADSTTDPPKYGAYWFGAFEPVEGDAACSISEDNPYRGQRFLRLSHATRPVLQKLATDPRGTERLMVSLALRTRRNGRLTLSLEDGPGRVATLRIAAPESGSVADVRVTDGQERPVAAARVTDGGAGWWRVELPVGEFFTAVHGSSPLPRLNLRLAIDGPPGALADVDEVVARVVWPLPAPAALRAAIEEQVQHTLRTWYLPEAEGGRGLIDAQTGYVAHNGCDVETGAPNPPEPSLGFHTIHKLLTKWMSEARRLGRHAEVERWQPQLERITRSLLAHNFDPDTGLPRRVAAGTLQPDDEEAVTVHAYVGALLDARELLADAALAEACLTQARAAADRLVALQREHDKPPEAVTQAPVWDPKLGRFVGDVSNWHGFLPDRMTPKGEIETDRLYYTSWAILTGRSFWYEMLRSPSTIVRVHSVAPRAGDLEAVRQIVAQFHRDWDASRYDLENDTDDHYGYLAEDGLEMLELAGAQLPGLLPLVQRATDHRLERNAASAGDTLWIQAVRLGTACAGDSPRAFDGPVRLYHLPSTVNPLSAGLPLYREAVLELAANDFKGRQLTNAQFTESFFKHWEMVCICYRGTYQGDCREHPPEYWNGDVGDTFGGPPYSAIDAQAEAFRIAGPAERALVLARLAILRDVTDATMRRPWGYLFGLDPAIGRQYELLEKYVIGLSRKSPAGVGYAMAWMRLLPALPDEPLPEAPAAEVVTRADGARELVIRAPAGSVVALPAQAQPFPAPLSERDPRMLALDAELLPGGLAAARRLTVGADGSVRLPLGDLGVESGLVQPLLLDAASGDVAAIGAAVSLD